MTTLISPTEFLSWFDFQPTTEKPSTETLIEYKDWQASWSDAGDNSVTLYLQSPSGEVFQRLDQSVHKNGRLAYYFQDKPLLIDWVINLVNGVSNRIQK